MPHLVARATLPLALLLAAPLGAQAPAAPPLLVGDSVRFRAVGRDAHGRRIDCDGRVRALTGDTIVLENVGRWSPCPRQLYEPASVAALQVARGRRGSRLAHAGLGLLIGGATGGVLGRALAGSGCSGGVHSCDDGDLAIAVLTFLGVVSGGATGLVIGVALPAGPRWVTVPAGSPVRFAGLAVQPGVRLRVGAR